MTSAPWLDTSLTTEERVVALLAVMSTAEKMSQLQCTFPRSCDAATSPTSVLEGLPLGVGHVSTLEMRRLTDREEAAAFQRTLQTEIIARQPHGIPAAFHMEAIDGATCPVRSPCPTA
ncbi:hypothetical protein [Actinomyces ruminis]|uniref:Uncharacterized protein n=1 Tax=Actinomyces ruminis TaxID=1937003 RepID=A0ABX4ME76_9ACTO|nr:hypothetical protein [Actinomyces ruminis]PHP53516.1 hypothetical protein BW737_001910 [Actinomyces ruminis]